MTERAELIERLQDLQGLSKQKKHRLANAEQEEVLSVLSALCNIDEDGYRTTVEIMSDFPSDVGVRFLANNWARLMETNRPVAEDLRSIKFKSDLGKRVRVGLAQSLLNTDPDNALRLLLDLFQEIKPVKKPIPTLADLWLIRTGLVEPDWQSLSRLPIQTATTSELTLLTTYILAATFVQAKSQTPLSSQTQLAIIRWANEFPRLGRLPQEVQNAIRQAVKKWSMDFRGILNKEINGLQAVLRETVALVCQTDSTEARPMESQSLARPPTVETMQRVDPLPLTPQKYSALYEIERLGNYVRSIQSQLNESQQKIQASERDLQQLHSELDVARRSREEAQQRSAHEHDSVMRMSAENDALRRENESLTQDLDISRKQFEQNVVSHGEQLDMLSERIAREGEHRVDAFRNKLGLKVQTYADSLKEAVEMEMTIDLGLALRNQMGQLLQLLKVEGIRVNGEL